ncbi:MAG: hypothetical protein QW815_02520, partial [Nitrososphaerota archaeon]
LIPYDAEKALKLWKQRSPYAPSGLPPIFDSEDDVKNPDRGRIGRNKLVLKPRNVAELMYYTMDDE